MKPNSIFYLFFVFVLIIAGCKKEPVVGISKPPVAVAGSDKNIFLPTDSALLDAVNSYDPDGIALHKWSWTKILGPASVTISTPSAAQTVIKNLVVGTYLFELKVIDVSGLTDTDTVQVKVNAATNNVGITSNIHFEKVINLMLPQDWVVLNNSYQVSYSDVNGIKWEKLNGPISYKFVYYQDYAVVSELVKGAYQFELTVNYTNGTHKKDTVNVNVFDVAIIPLNAKEIVLAEHRWTYPWYPTLEIEKFYSLIPREALFRIFIKRDNQSNWEEASGMPYEYSGASYEYLIERRLPDGAGMYTNNSLFIFYYGANTVDAPGVKIVYW